MVPAAALACCGPLFDEIAPRLHGFWTTALLIPVVLWSLFLVAAAYDQQPRYETLLPLAKYSTMAEMMVLALKLYRQRPLVAVVAEEATETKKTQ